MVVALEGGDPSPPPPLDIEAFHTLVSSVKKLTRAPPFEICQETGRDPIGLGLCCLF
jgi:hypothetical protein